MKILFINNDGGGFADYVEVAQGTTVEKFFSQKVQGRKLQIVSPQVDRGLRLAPAQNILQSYVTGFV